MNKELQFNTTVKIVEFEDYNILIESYWEYSDSDEDKEIFDVAKEYKFTNRFSETEVLFESYNLNECYDFVWKNFELDLR